MNSILVTGGTGHLGRKVVDVLVEKGFKTGILTTQKDLKSEEDSITYYTGDLADNTGLKEATDNADIIIHCASNPRDFQRVDEKGTKNLLKAIDQKRVKHLVYISIVGVDKSDYPYYQAKLEIENKIRESGLPYTIVRATQFHQFVRTMIEQRIRKIPDDQSVLKILKGLKFQSISTQEVAELLVSVSLEAPKGLLPDFGGKEVLSLAEMTAKYLAEFQLDLQVQSEMTDDIRDQQFRSGINLCPENAFGRESWEDFLRRVKRERNT